MRLDFRDPEPEVVDLSPEGGVVETLKESKIECLMNEKVRPHRIFTSSVFELIGVSVCDTSSLSILCDACDPEQDIYLYYFLLRYPGRTLVFLASVDGIRRMLPLFELLGLPVYPLHSQMEQKQRLKNLDRFVS